MAQNAPFAVYARALKEARAYWPHIGLVLLLGLAWTPLALLTPLPLKLIVDNVLGDQPLPAYVTWAVPAGFGTGTEAVLALAIILSVMIALFGIVHTAADWLLREYVAERMVLDFRGRLFLHSLHTSLLSHFKRGSHEPAYRINLDAPALQWTALYGIVPVILALTSLGSMLYVTSLIAPRLALVALATAIPIILLIHLNQARMRNKWHGVREKESAAQSVVQEALGALRVVTVFGQEQREQQRYLGAARAGLRARLRVVQLEGVFSMGLGLATALGTTAILYLGVRDVQAGAIAVGDLLLIMGYIGQLYGPLQTIGNHITGQQRAIASAERAFGMLDEKPMVEERPGARALDEARGEIVFDDVTFAYPNTERPTLRNVNLRLPAGASVGIIGRSGAGKSTLINRLVPGAAAPTGEISQALAAGRHTTTTTTWYWLDAARTSALIDSPGFQEFGLHHIEPAQLAAYMPDIRPHVTECRFYNCTHRHEPGCGVISHVESASSAGQISASRYKIYSDLWLELRSAPH